MFVFVLSLILNDFAFSKNTIICIYDNKKKMDENK